MKTLLTIVISLCSIPLAAQLLHTEGSSAKASYVMMETDLPALGTAMAPAQAENQLVLEDWMLQPFGNQDITLSECLEVSEEHPLNLEDWMYCCADWNIEIKVPGRNPEAIEKGSLYLALD